jgi:glycosyltransferase involved in cell wall biosynthesis
MNVLIFEPWHTGHHYEYLHRIIPALRALGVQPVLATTQAGSSSPQFDIHLRGFQPEFRTRTFPNLTTHSKLRARLQVRHHLSQAILAESPDHIYVPSADMIGEILLLSPAIRRRLPFIEGLHLFGGFGYPRLSLRDYTRSRFDGFIAARAPWSVYAHLDPWQLVSLCQQYPHMKGKSLLMPDPVDPPMNISCEAARAALGIPENGIYLGSAGPMNYRKGVDRLLRAFAAALSQLPKEARLLLAGPFEPSLKHRSLVEYSDLLAQKRMIVIDRHLTQHEIAIVIPAMDIVCAPYPHHVGSSGIVLRAVANRRPILAMNRCWLRNTVETLGVGTTCNVLDLPSFVEGIVRAFHNHETYPQLAIVDRYLQFHSQGNFVSTWTMHLRDRLGMVPANDRVCWDWVVGRC